MKRLNHKLHAFASIALMLISLCVHAFETGQTVRLVNRGKSIFVENSSLDENKNAVLWTETNVNAQRWSLTGKTNGTFFLSNDYTGFYLAGLSSGTSGTVGQTNRTAANTKGSWEFVPVEGTTNQYYIYHGTTRKYALAAAADATEGSTLTIVNTSSATSIDPARITWTVEVVEPMAKEFTKDKRDDMMVKWKARAYKQANTGWVIGNGGWWGDAEMFEIVLDALETTGDQQYATMFDNLYTNFIARNKDTWYQSGVSGYNEYNDDIAWMCIACVRAYLLTGQTKYRTTAKKNFDGMFARADCYGNDLLQWKHNSGQGTTSCINGPAAVCACYLAIAQADDSYYEKARKTYMAERRTLFEMSNGKPTGAVWDSYDQASGNYNKWCSTYNQGTNLGAAIMLYNHYGEQMFKDDADAIIKWSEKNMANSKGIIHVCQTVSGDLCGFKGIMLRYLRMYAESFNDPSHYAWIAKNAYHAWNNRNSAGITSSAWLTKAEENFKHQEGSDLKGFGNDGNMTCVSAAFNCHLGAVDSHDAFAMNEAEDFNFVRNAPVAYENNADEDNGGMVGPMKNTNYIGYRRVDFGSTPASHIDIRTKITLSATGINVYLDYPNATKGILLCSVKGSELTALKTWDTVRKMINQPVTGVHDVYFVSSGSGQTHINWWQFQSLNSIYPDLTNGNGTISTSYTNEDATALIDDDPTTSLTADIQSGTEKWVMFESPSPMRLYGYQVFSGASNSADPKGWTLQASTTGKIWVTLHTVSDITFNARGERYNADVETSKAYRYYRLLFNCNETQTKLSVSEWQLLGNCIDSNDITADGGTVTEGYESLIDHVGSTDTETPATVRYQANGLYKLTAYSITAKTKDSAPKAWKLEGSTNGITWNIINEQIEANFPYDNYTYVCRVNPSTSYLYYRLSIQEEGAQLKQWQLFGKQDFGSFFADITKVSTILACNNDDASALTDKDGKTYSTISGTESLYWIINTPLPVKVLGYSLINGNDAELDPKKVLLYGYDENGIATQLSSKTPTFQTRGTRLTYTTTTTKLFKRFTLVVDDETTPQVRLADVELYSSAIVDADNPYIHMPSSVEASADGLSNTELIGKLNDASRTTAYRAAFTQPVAITYTYDQPVSINAYTISAAKNEPTRDPASWTLEGSNDGNTWAQIDSQTGEAFSQRYATQFYTTGTTPSYKYYRLTVTATNGAEQLQIGELQLFTLEPASTDDPTGINEIERTNIEDGAIYNIAGQRLQKLQRGINIVNGKKILIK
jgi:predicted alpha-1,6-mannanase (GH76 family)